MVDLTEDTGRRIVDGLESLNRTLNSPNRLRGDQDNLDNSASRFRNSVDRGAGSIDTLTGFFGKLLTGTVGTTDALDMASGALRKFGTIGGAAADIFNQLGKSAIAVNETLKETGRYGVTFGNDLGQYNKAVLDAHLTLDDFRDIVADNSTSMAGLQSTMDKSAKGYLSILSDVTTSDIGRDLRAAGMSARELAEITQLSMSRKRLDDIKDVNARDKLIESALRMATEFDFVSDLTGKSRKQLLEDQRKITESTEIKSAILQMGPEFKESFDQAASGLSPVVQRVLAERATGGVRTEEGLSLIHI